MTAGSSPDAHPAEGAASPSTLQPVVELPTHLGGERLAILVLADNSRGHANTVLDHVRALRRLSRHRVDVFNPRGLNRSRLLKVDAYDVLVIHYSLAITFEQYLSDHFKSIIRGFTGLKIQFIQDEYRWIDDVGAAMADLGIEVIFTAADDESARRIYGPRVPRAETVGTLTGYLPDELLGRSTRPLRERSIDVGYRGRVVPFWLGDLGQDKVRISQGFIEKAQPYDLKLDIAWREEDRIYGEAWNHFIAECRCMLGTESGASIADFDGSLHRRVDAYLASHPGASYEEVHGAVLVEAEGNLRIQAISPRAFEAIALRTALIQFPGSYSGILRPWDHYIPLEKDFSNIDEVVRHVRDLPALEAMAERAYTDVALSGKYSYRAMVGEFDDVVDRRVQTARRRRAVSAYWFSSDRLLLSRVEARGRYGVARLAGRVSSFASRVRASYGPGVLVRRVFARLGLWSRIRRSANIVLLFRASRRHPPVFRLVRIVVTDSETRARLTGTGLLSDLIRLAVLAEAAVNPRRTGFRVVGKVGDDGRVAFRSRTAALPPPPSSSPVADRRERLLQILAGKRLREIVWMHGAVGNAFSYPLVFRRRLHFELALDGGTAYRFNALALWARTHPELIADALGAALGEPDGAGEAQRPARKAPHAV